MAQPSAWIRPAARATSTTPVKQQAQESSERDLVNFPRRTRPIDRPNVRHHWIPEEFFQFFHAKTGVTGPYMFMGGLTTFLLSKEIWVIEHEFWVGIAIFIVWGGAIKMIGPGFTKNINEELAKDDARIKAIRQDEIDRCKNAIDNENNSQWMATSYEELMKAKKENVALQLEANYRQRLQDAYQQVRPSLKSKSLAASYNVCLIFRSRRGSTTSSRSATS